MTAGIILIVVGVMVLFGTIFVAFQIVPKLGGRFGASSFDITGTPGTVPATASWLRNLTLAVGLIITAVLVSSGTFIVIAADEEPVPRPSPAASPAPTRPGASPAETAQPTLTAEPATDKICGTTWDVTGGPGGGTFEFEAPETRNGGTICRYTELNNIGDFFGEGTATVKTNEVHLEGFDSFIGDYETDLEIRGDSMVGDKAYEQGARFPLALRSQ